VVPETRWEDWKQRGLGLPLRAAWTNVSGLTDQYLRRFDALDEGTQLRYFALLGRDMASVQRDGLIYFNAIERLKNEPTDTVADEVVEHLRKLGFTSIDMPEPVGGPPTGESPRPFGKVLDWLIKQLAKVGRFLLNAVAFITTRLNDLGLSSVALQIGWPVAVSLEFPPNLFRDPPRWRKAKELIDNFLTDMGDKVFGS